MPTAPRSRSELDLATVDWRRIDETGEEAIARQAAEDSDTAPVLTPEELLAIGRRIATDEVEDVRAAVAAQLDADRRDISRPGAAMR